MDDTALSSREWTQQFETIKRQVQIKRASCKLTIKEVMTYDSLYRWECLVLIDLLNFPTIGEGVYRVTYETGIVFKSDVCCTIRIRNVMRTIE